jgi:hypothetical protein
VFLLAITAHRVVDTVLLATFLSSGLTTVILEFVIRARVNQHLAADERIGIDQLQWPWTWLGRNGLLVRYRHLYPASRLATVFCALWIVFLMVLTGSLVYAKFAK